MNREAFATHQRDRKVRCFARTLELIARPHQPSPDQMLDWVSGLSDTEWQDVAVVASATHDCGVTHDAPSEDTQMEIVNLFTTRAIQADKIGEKLTAELAARAGRGRRHMKVMS